MLSSRISRNITFVGAATAINSLAPILTAPVALHFWGKAKYGEWLVLSGLLTFLSIADLGLQAYGSNLMCAAYNNHRYEEVCRLLRRCLTAQVWALVAVLLFFLPIWAIVTGGLSLHLEMASKADAMLTLGIIAVNIMIWVPMGLVPGFLRSAGHLDYTAKFGAVHRTVSLLLTLLLIGFRQPFSVVAAARLATDVVGSLLLFRQAKIMFPWLRLEKGETRSYRSLLGNSVFFVMFSFSDFLAAQLVLAIVAAQLGVVQVSQLATQRTIYNAIVMAAGIISSSVAPELTRSYAIESPDKVRRIFTVYLAGHIALVLAALSVLSLVAPTIYALWTARTLTLDLNLSTLLNLHMLVWSCWYPFATLFLSTHRHKVVAGLSLAMAFIVVIGTRVGTSSLGLTAYGLSVVIGDLVCAVGVVVAYCLQVSTGWLKWSLTVIALPAVVASLLIVYWLAGAGIVHQLLLPVMLIALVAYASQLSRVGPIRIGWRRLFSQIPAVAQER